MAAVSSASSCRWVSPDEPDLGPRNVAGHAYPHSIHSTTSRCDTSHTVEYNLGKRYRQVVAAAGLADSSRNREGRVLFEAFLDARPVFAQTVGLGQAAPVRVNAQGATRLTLQTTYVGPHTATCLEDTAVWGDARLLGVPSDRPASGGARR